MEKKTVGLNVNIIITGKCNIADIKFFIINPRSKHASLINTNIAREKKPKSRHNNSLAILLQNLNLKT